MTEFLAPLLGHAIAEWITWLSANGGLVALGPLLIQLAKKSNKFPWLDDYSDVANRAWSGLFAVASTVGIGYAYDINAGTLLLSGITPLGIARFLLEASARFGFQELVYRWLIKGR